MFQKVFKKFIIDTNMKNIIKVKIWKMLIMIVNFDLKLVFIQGYWCTDERWNLNF